MNAPIVIKHIGYALIFLLLSVIHTQAQTNKVEIGIRAGVTVSTLFSYRVSAYADDSSYSSADGPLFSAFGALTVSIPLANDFAIQTGLQYTGKGGKFNNYGQTGSYETRFYYGVLPFTLVKHFKIGESSFYAGGGGYLAYMVKGQKQSRLYGPLGEPIDPPEYADSYNRFDKGLKLTIGYQPLRHINVDLGYDIGLHNTIKDSETNLRANHSWSLGIGYNF